MQELNGVLILHKTGGMTSQSAVNRVKRLLSVKKAGHTGTLDPMATGVLPILVGKATRLSDFLTESRKHYRAELVLGVTSDTEDVTGEVLTTSDELPSAEAVLEAAGRFIGDILQVPPMYSALKRDGHKLCDLARRGIDVAREARRITVYALEVTPLSRDRYSLDVVCSKGTYIRTLCADIGASLGVGGVMASLVRVETAGFHLDHAYTLDAIEAMTEDERAAAVIPVEELVRGYDAVTLPPFFARLARSGCEIYQKKIGTHYPVGKIVTMKDECGIFAIGEVREYMEDEEGRVATAIKPIRTLV